MRTVNVHEAKTRFPALLADVEGGEHIIIAKAGKPVARLLPFGAPAPPHLGIDDGRLWIADDFDTFVPPEFEPFDRIIVGQALAENLTLVTADRRLAEYPVTVHDARS